MAKKDEDLQVAFEEEAPEVVEEYVREGEEAKVEDPDASLPEEVRKKTKSELVAEAEALRKAAAEKPDSTVELSRAMDKLADRLSPSEREAPAQPQETEEQLASRLETDLFDKAKMLPALKEVVTRTVAPILQAASAREFQTALKLLRLDPEEGSIFKEYEAETLAYMKKNFRGFENSPQALDLAYAQVKAKHVNDIAEKIAMKRIEEERKKTAPAVAAREPLSLEAGRASSRQPVKKTITITSQDEREAELKGVSPEVIARARVRRMSGGR